MRKRDFLKDFQGGQLSKWQSNTETLRLFNGNAKQELQD